MSTALSGERPKRRRGLQSFIAQRGKGGRVCGFRFSKALAVPEEPMDGLVGGRE